MYVFIILVSHRLFGARQIGIGTPIFKDNLHTIQYSFYKLNKHFKMIKAKVLRKFNFQITIQEEEY